jgi:hypothetical protein
VLVATRHSACAAKISAISQLKALIIGAPEEPRAELEGWWLRWRRGCWSCPGRAHQRRRGAGGLVVCQVGCARRPPSLPWPAPTPSRRPRDRSPAAGLNRLGDRQLSRALHTVVVARLRDDPDTRAYAARRQAEGKSSRDTRRCLKRAAARQLFKLLERHDRSTVQLRRLA